MAHRDQHSGRSGNWHGYPSSDGDGSTPSHPQLPQLPQGNTAPASRFSHPMAGGGQHQTGGVVAPDPSLWQYRTGGSYPTFGPQSHMSQTIPHPTSSDPTGSYPYGWQLPNTGGSYPTFGPQSHLSQTIPHPTSSDPTGSYPTFGPQSHMSQTIPHPTSSDPTGSYPYGWQLPNTGGSYPTFGPQSHMSQTIPHPTSSDPTTSQANHASGYHTPQHEDLAGTNHPIPQFNPRTTAAALSAYDYFRVPMAISPNFPTTLTLTPFDSSTSLAAPTQSSSTALGACSPNDQGHLLSSGANDAVGRVVKKRPIPRKLAHKQMKFIPAKIPSASTQSTPTLLLHIDSAVVAKVKDEATRLMILSLFQKSLYPATDNDITTLANTALDEAITKHPLNEKELVAWKLWPEGQSALARLKGTVKQVHKNCQGCAWGIVIGAYRLYLPILFNQAHEVAPLRTRGASGVLKDVNHLDALIKRDTSDGQGAVVRVPFGNSTVLTVVEYVLVNQGYRKYLSFDINDWGFRLENTIALSAAICDWILRVIEDSNGSGWPTDTDFHTPKSEECYMRMRRRIASLAGSDLVEFRNLMLLIRNYIVFTFGS
ncbi:hypothetical protein DEU56DRAFT_913064 [Suillus clintonianus]|uniref:uncharacterized protein n=1 Tax=Suillus clintonianus TaxID=1904413 RepID=UPI001B866B6F|nr:uncharacterized protein DEU56DRAFT_913064 [Suillus clintonianus]KAG2135971.1 hypothetical protein DEU56DRAFT_913064 [Suillus clintonianus]